MIGFKRRGKSEVIQALQGVWNPGIFQKVCLIEILYYPKTGEYNMRLSGHEPKMHPIYLDAVNTMNRLKGRNEMMTIAGESYSLLENEK